MSSKAKTKYVPKPKVESKVPKYSGKGTRARLNTAAEKHVFNTNHS